MPEWITELQI